MEGSIEDALKGLEKVHKTIPKPPQSAKPSEKKTVRKPKIFKGESYKVRSLFLLLVKKASRDNNKEENSGTKKRESKSQKNRSARLAAFLELLTRSSRILFCIRSILNKKRFGLILDNLFTKVGLEKHQE